MVTRPPRSVPQGLLLSSAQQMLDRLVAQIREQVRTLRETGAAAADSERPQEHAITRAEAVCGDAQRCKQVSRSRHTGAQGETYWVRHGVTLGQEWGHTWSYTRGHTWSYITEY